MTETETMVRLERVSKRYRGSEAPAVDELTLDIPRGEIVMLIGPSGCGKTTTLKMINRLIEPSSGRILINGDDVTQVNGEQLRRRIGYVIQQIGLFPHMRIRENIAIVPKLLGWDRARIDARVDELLEMVGMDPATFRDRYPKQLSGGQRQRIGVARAMAADPPVLLMDEPFGAIDPITRDHLQNEFLRLQEEINKTIVFVTHDIDEAIKMGDRICLLREGGKIAQYDTPERILSQPADEFVADFIGSGATLKRLNLVKVTDYELNQTPTVTPDQDAAAALAAVRAADSDWVLLLDERNRPSRWISRSELRRTSRPLRELGAVAESVLDAKSSLNDALNEMLNSNAGAAPVTDRRGAYLGVVDIEMITGAIETLRAEQRVEERRRREAEEAAE